MQERIKIWLNSSIIHHRQSEFNKTNTKREDFKIHNTNLVEVVNEYYDKINTETSNDISQKYPFMIYLTLIASIFAVFVLFVMIKFNIDSKKVKNLFKKRNDSNL